MEIDLANLIQNLKSDEATVLMKLYYNRDSLTNGFNESIFEAETLHSLLDKNLILTSLVAGESIVSLTEDGLNICGSVMFNRITERNLDFKTEVQSLSQRAVSCLVNRVLWKDATATETGFVDELVNTYSLDESLWYERVLLNDKRVSDTLEEFYGVLEDLDFIENNDGQRWCSPEVEGFLKKEYKSNMDLSWAEEDSLKYYYFFFAFAQSQKNLIDFSGGGEDYRSMFFEDSILPLEYWLSSSESKPRSLLASLGISNKRISEFFDEMQDKGVVNQRYYPLSSDSFFSDDDTIFVIQDIKSFMGFITGKFLTPVVDSLLA